MTHADNGTVLLTGTAAYPSGPFETPPTLTDLGNVSGHFRVQADGTIERWRVGYDADFDGRTVTVVRTGELFAVGEMAVEQPDWVANATAIEE